MGIIGFIFWIVYISVEIILCCWDYVLFSLKNGVERRYLLVVVIRECEFDIISFFSRF